jgi:hypothetical protein
MGRAKPGPGFEPREALFAPSTACNLRCRHCAVEPDPRRLPIAAALRFLDSCRGTSVERVGFTGGEPFLQPAFLEAVTARVVRLGLLFDRITTNAAWFKTRDELNDRLTRLRDKGYDGSFYVSLDAFHGRSVRKPALFIEAAAQIWNRPDIAGLIAVRGGRDQETEALLDALAVRLGARLVRRGPRPRIVSPDLILPISTVDLVPVGRAAGWAAPWDGAWPEEDFCAGPGQVLSIQPDGSVKACCGYATDSDRLTIGDIRRQTAPEIIAAASRNPFVRTVYRSGLSAIRRRLVTRGASFPGRTSNACAFCHHLLTSLPGPALDAALDPDEL